MSLRASLAIGAGLAVLAAPSSAQKLERSGGLLGTSSVYYLSEGTNFGFYVLGLSISQGPTPLMLFEPGNPYVMDIGLEALGFWQFGTFSPTGTAQYQLPLPGNPNFNGAPLWAQYLEIAPPSFSLGPVSNRVGHTLGGTGFAHNTIGSNLSEIFAHTNVSLLDGRILQTGGYTIAGQIDTFSAFDPQTEEFSAVGGQMQNFRTQHTATTMNDGRVLLVGGADSFSNVFDTVDIWDPATNTCTPAPPISLKRCRHTATLLPDGRVLITGGIGNFSGDVLTALNSTEATCEIFDPTTDTWSAAASMALPRVGHAATLLGDGRVLVTAGIEVATSFGLPIPSISNTATRYDHTTDQWLATASMPHQCGLHAQLTLANGDAVTIGGADGNLLTQSLFPIANTAMYDHQNNTWSATASLNYARAIPSVVTAGLNLVVASGFETMDLISLQGKAVGQYETAPVLPLIWNAGKPMVAPREHSQTIVFDGGQRVLTTGMASNATGPIPGDDTAEILIP